MRAHPQAGEEATPVAWGHEEGGWAGSGRGADTGVGAGTSVRSVTGTAAGRGKGKIHAPKPGRVGVVPLRLLPARLRAGEAGSGAGDQCHGAPRLPGAARRRGAGRVPRAAVRTAPRGGGKGRRPRCGLRAASCRLGWGAGSAGAAGPQPEHRWVSDRGLRHVPRSGPRFQSGCTASAAGPEVGGSPWAFQFRATEQTPFLVEGAGQTEAVGRWPAGLPHRVLG